MNSGDYRLNTVCPGNEDAGADSTAVYAATNGVVAAVQTLAATSSGGGTVTLSGFVAETGNPAWFEFGTSPTLSDYQIISATNRNGRTVSTEVTFPPGKTYYYRVVGGDSSSSDRGGIMAVK